MNPAVFLFGASSVLGFHLARLYPQSIRAFVPEGNAAAAARRWTNLQLDDPAWPPALFDHQAPQILIYCHAVCDVPKCEAAPEWAHRINVAYLSRVVAALPDTTRLVYVSSDHVFGGDGIYDETAHPAPISVYGRTRVKAESLALDRQNSLVVRVGLAIGPSLDGRTGHYDWLRHRARRNLPITIVHDEVRSAVWAGDLADRVMSLAHSAATGLRHMTATRAVSRVVLANHLLSLLGEKADYRCESRHQRGAPHLGRVELASMHRDELSEPLAGVTDGGPVRQKNACSFD